MKIKFNLALVPDTKSQQFVELANQLALKSCGYCLGLKSVPHVTLYHFYAKKDELPVLVQKMAQMIGKTTIELTFKEFSCISFDGIVNWVSLIPNNIVALNEMHQRVAQVLNKPAKLTFDPHLTLMNTKDTNYIEMIEPIINKYKCIKDTFTLTLGYADPIGQYLSLHTKIVEPSRR